MRAIVSSAIDQLCVAFAKGGYNPTPIIDLGVLVVIADGVVDDRERAVLLELFQTLLDTTLSSDVVDHLLTSSMAVAKEAGLASRARLIAEILLDCDAVEPGILVALAVAFASEGLSKEERGVIEQLADAAELPRARLEQLIAMVSKHSEGADPVSVRTLLKSTPDA